MTSKLSLLGGIAAGALLFATGAAALPALTVNADGSGNAYKLASEAVISGSDTLTFNAQVKLQNDNTIPSGNVLLTLTLTGGEFEGAIGAGVLGGTGPNVPDNCSVSSTVSDGGDGENFVQFLLSGATAGACDTFSFTGLTVVPTGSGTVSLRAAVETEGGTAIDGRDSNSANVITRGNAFSVTFAPGTDATALLASGAPGPYRLFSDGATPPAPVGTATLGSVTVSVDTSFFKDLSNNPVSEGDVDALRITVDGAWASFQSGDPVVTAAALGGQTPSVSGSIATYDYTGIGAGAGDFAWAGAPAPISSSLVLTANGTDAIQARKYTGSAQLTLDPANYGTSGANVYSFGGGNGNFGEILRDGTSVIVPGVLSRYLVDRLKENNQIRIGNIGDDDTGAVYVSVLSSSRIGTNPPPYNPPANADTPLVDSIPVGGEFTINSTALTNKLGQFGRGDIQLSIEADPSDIVVRRFYRGATGDWTEVSSGTVAQDQN